MHSVPKSAVLPYASGVGGLSRRLLNTHDTEIHGKCHYSLVKRFVRNYIHNVDR